MLWRSLRSPLRGPSIIFYKALEDSFVCWCAGALVCWCFPPKWTSNNGENDDQLWNISITFDFLALSWCKPSTFGGSQPFNHWFTGGFGPGDFNSRPFPGDDHSLNHSPKFGGSFCGMIPLPTFTTILRAVAVPLRHQFVPASRQLVECPGAGSFSSCHWPNLPFDPPRWVLEKVEPETPETPFFVINLQLQWYPANFSHLNGF